MADRACLNTPTGQIVLATQDNLRKDSLYYCSTPNCQAKMYLVAHGERQAHFRSESHANHISIRCTKNNILFNPDEYSDDGFDMESFKEFTLGDKEPLNIHIGPHNGGRGQVGHNRRIVPHTLKQLYYCFISRDLNASFGNITHIGDVLICRDNIGNYINGFASIKICEFTFYSFTKPADVNGIYQKGYFMINIPTYNNIFINAKLIIDTDKLFQKIAKHFKSIPNNKRHSELAVVIGDWSLSDDPRAIVECHIRTQKQITYVE